MIRSFTIVETINNFYFRFTNMLLTMKNFVRIFLVACLVSSIMSCSLFKSKKTGCPSNGKNIGAEKLASGDPAAEKAARKAKKFKS